MFLLDFISAAFSLNVSLSDYCFRRNCIMKLYLWLLASWVSAIFRACFLASSIFLIIRSSSFWRTFTLFSTNYASIAVFIFSFWAWKRDPFTPSSDFLKAVIFGGENWILKPWFMKVRLSLVKDSFLRIFELDLPLIEGNPYLLDDPVAVGLNSI